MRLRDGVVNMSVDMEENFCSRNDEVEDHLQGGALHSVFGFLRGLLWGFGAVVELPALAMFPIRSGEQ